MISDVWQFNNRLIQASGNDFARLMGCQLGLSEKRLPHSIFHFHAHHALKPKFPHSNGHFLGENHHVWTGLCWLNSPGLEESYHSEQQKLLERIRSLERAAAPGTQQWMCGGSQLRP